MIRHQTHFPIDPDIFPDSQNDDSRLAGFRVGDFSPANGSGWLPLVRVPILTGVRESGKTTLRTPLSRLNPARDGEIAPIVDHARSLFATFRATAKRSQLLTVALVTCRKAARLPRQAGIPDAQGRRIPVARNLDGT